MNLNEAITEIEKRLAKAKEHLAVSYVEKQISDWRGRVEVLTEVLTLLKQVEPKRKEENTTNPYTSITSTSGCPDIKMTDADFRRVSEEVSKEKWTATSDTSQVPKRSRPVRTRGQ